MVNRNRTIVRTPRRRKVWAQFNETTQLGVGTSSPKAIDMLDAFYTDLGAGPQGGLTVMRVVGNIKLAEWTGSAPATPIYQEIRIGILWLAASVADNSDGDGSIPQPLQDGIREDTWIQQWKFGGDEAPATPRVGRPLTPIEEAMKDVDVTQQRRQPSAGHKLSMVISGGASYETASTAVISELSILLALP